jgi:hypothetical protein
LLLVMVRAASDDGDFDAARPRRSRRLDLPPAGAQAVEAGGGAAADGGGAGEVAAAKARLADEYNAAQERGEIAGQGKPVNLPDGKVLPTAEDIGLTRKQIHEARQIRDAERAEPGIVHRTLNDRIQRGEEPTKAALRAAVVDAATRAAQPSSGSKKIRTRSAGRACHAGQV